MSVELWYGEKPGNFAEQSVLVDIYNYLQSSPEHFALMTSFHAGASGEIDLMVLKRSALLIIELKHYWSKIVGKRGGEWYVEKGNGERQSFRNPYQQVRSCRHKWIDWCRKEKKAIFPNANLEMNAELLDPFEYVVVFPDINPQSDIDVGIHPVQVMGFPKFRTELMIRGKDGLNLSREDRQRFPQLLSLKRWHIEPPERHDATVKLDDDYKPPAIQMLVARAHEYSHPTLYLEKDTIVVGRDWACDLVVQAPSVSRKHAILRKQQTRWVVEDLDSDNGTYVSFNGDPQFERRIDKVNALKNGSIIRFGEASYTFLLSD